MRSIRLTQLLLILCIFFFLFGDFLNLKKKIINFLKYFNNYINNNKKKGT